MSKLIIDVSKYNSRIEWPEVKPHIQKAIIRLGYRGWGMRGALVVDDRFHYNVRSCIYENIPWDVYYFPQEISEGEVVDAVDFIGETLSEYPEPGTIWLDSEYANGGSGRGDKISAHKRSVILGMMRSILENSNRKFRVGLYCSDSWYKDNINNSIAGFTNLWIARYSDKPPKNTDAWELWQYTSKGELPGIRGRVDLSITKNDFELMRGLK